MPPPTYQHDIFLSYAREDRDRIKRLAQELESLGWSVWWDRRIPTGQRFAKVIEQQLDASKTVAVAWSTRSIDSDWVHTEAAEGLRRGVLFPVLIDEVTIPLEFRRVQAANLIHWQGDVSDEHWQLFVADLKETLGSPPHPLTPDSSHEVEKEPLVKPHPTKPKKSPKQIPEGMVLIPKGPFLYGDDKQEVTIDHDYYMDIHPVTNAVYRTFIEAGGYDKQSHWSAEGWRWRTKKKITKPEYCDNEAFNRPDQPVVGVNYYEAEAYAKWAGKRLPTEQEWEKAARGTDGREYPWEGGFDATKCASSVSVGTVRGNTAIVGSYPEGASPYGCYDMVGNVWEWCASWYDKDKDCRVLRGGSWLVNDPEYFRCALRNYFNPRYRYNFIGFRCVQDAP